MLVKTYASAVHGIHATTITIEVNISRGINFFIVNTDKLIIPCCSYINFYIINAKLDCFAVRGDGVFGNAFIGTAMSNHINTTLFGWL